MSTSHPDLVHLLRGSALESVHRGALAIIDANGRVVKALGDVDRPIFSRSACKVLQALPLVASGAADAMGLSDAELALACASHNGEPAHVATAAAMLAKAGLAEAVLECGSHWPRQEPVLRAMVQAGGIASALHNNCSGKHAGFVCLGCLMARQAGTDPHAFLRGYVKPDHPVMREVAAALSATTGADLGKAPMGTDGCSIPTYALSLQAWALAFARVATGQGLSSGHAGAAQRLRQAVAREPFYVAGSKRFDTVVMQRLGERVFCKVGAEGVYCAALPEQGLGVAIKIDDGNTSRATEVVMATVIEALVRLDDDERQFMRSLSDAPQHNWNGLLVGQLQASPALRQTLAGQA